MLSAYSSRCAEVGSEAEFSVVVAVASAVAQAIHRYCNLQIET